MNVYLNQGFDREIILKQLLIERTKQNKCGYLELNLISEKNFIFFTRIYLNSISIEQVKKDLEEIYTDLKRYKKI